MPGLGKTTAKLNERRKAMDGQGRGGESGLAESRGFGFNPGALRMLSYVPEGLAAGAPLVVVLHGCTQSAGSHMRAAGWRALADRLGFAILAPEQDRANNHNRCFNWFQRGDIARGGGEVASIHAMAQHMMRSHDLDAGRVFVTGLSAGGAMTAALLAAYPETFAAGAVIAGLPFGVAGSIQEALAAMRGGTPMDSRKLGDLVAGAAPPPPRKPRLTIWHGEADTTVVSSNASALARQWGHYQGLAERPDDVHSRGGWTRSVWRAADGEVLIEMNLLAGHGHGTPLATGGEDPIGAVAPFMLEAGVSSSLEIARFWGLAPPAPASHKDAEAADGPAFEQRSRGLGLGEQVLASVSPHVSDEVRKVIASALGSAGLLR